MEQIEKTVLKKVTSSQVRVLRGILDFLKEQEINSNAQDISTSFRTKQIIDTIDLRNYITLSTPPDSYWYQKDLIERFRGHIYGLKKAGLLTTNESGSRNTSFSLVYPIESMENLVKNFPDGINEGDVFHVAARDAAPCPESIALLNALTAFKNAFERAAEEGDTDRLETLTATWEAAQGPISEIANLVPPPSEPNPALYP